MGLQESLDNVLYNLSFCPYIKPKPSGDLPNAQYIKSINNGKDFELVGGIKPISAERTSTVGFSLESADYLSILDAYSAVDTTGLTANNRHLIYVQPGLYSETDELVLNKPYVDFVGLGLNYFATEIQWARTGHAISIQNTGTNYIDTVFKNISISKLNVPQTTGEYSLIRIEDSMSGYTTKLGFVDVRSALPNITPVATSVHFLKSYQTTPANSWVTLEMTRCLIGKICPINLDPTGVSRTIDLTASEYTEFNIDSCEFTTSDKTTEIRFIDLKQAFTRLENSILKDNNFKLQDSINSKLVALKSSGSVGSLYSTGNQINSNMEGVAPGSTVHTIRLAEMEPTTLDSGNQIVSINNVAFTSTFNIASSTLECYHATANMALVKSAFDGVAPYKILSSTSAPTVTDIVSSEETNTLLSEVAYTPSEPAKWADPDPTTIKEAIDRLASLVYTLNSDTEIP